MSASYKHNPLPTPGDIVWCHFPITANLGNLDQSPARISNRGIAWTPCCEGRVRYQPKNGQNLQVWICAEESRCKFFWQRSCVWHQVRHEHGCHDTVWLRMVRLGASSARPKTNNQPQNGCPTPQLPPCCKNGHAELDTSRCIVEPSLETLL